MSKSVYGEDLVVKLVNERDRLEAALKQRTEDVDGFYAGWNAAIATVREVAQAQGWWLPESVDGLRWS